MSVDGPRPAATVRIGPLTLLAMTAVGVGAAPGASAAAPDVLLPLAFKQVMEAGAAGTGCSWSPGRGRRYVFAAADDRAVVRLSSGIVPLKPAQGAGDLFPGTFDRWLAEGLVVELHPRGPTRVRGESIVQSARLSTTLRGRTVGRDGVLDCGS